VKRVVMVAVIALLGAACSPPGTSSGSSSGPTPTQRPGLGFDVTATERVNAITIHVGQKLEVVLHPVNGITFGAPLLSSDQSILRDIADRGELGAAAETAAFEAVAVGHADVTAGGTGIVCSPGAPCPPASGLAYLLKVSVIR
jgi:hypothetical protein